VLQVAPAGATWKASLNYTTNGKVKLVFINTLQVKLVFVNTTIVGRLLTQLSEAHSLLLHYG
jgi:hypothetical protein